MSKIKFYILSLLILVLCFSSCTIEKRIYSSGYHIEWNKSNRVLFKKKLGNDNNREQTELSKTEPVEQSETGSYVVDNSTKATDQNIIASVDNETVIVAKKETINIATIQKREINEPNVNIESTIDYDGKKEIKTIRKSSNEEPKINVNAVISFASAILAIFASAIFLPFILLVGVIPSLIFGAIALKQFKDNPGKYKYKGLYKGLAIFGVVFGYLGCFIGILISIFFILAEAMYGEALFVLLFSGALIIFLLAFIAAIIIQTS